MIDYKDIIKHYRLASDGTLEKYYNGWRGQTGWHTFKGTLHNKKGYYLTKLFGKTIYVHQIVWMLANKKTTPIGMEVDHIDRNKTNNIPNNLRVVSCRGNHLNNKRSVEKGGLPGAYLLPYGKWFSNIQIHGKSIHLGVYETKEMAHEAYMKAYRAVET